MASRNYTNPTRHRLYSLAGNTCSHPDCEEKLLGEDYNLSEICHIEALNKGGPRYNPNSDDKERNDFPNLILLCKNHHGIMDETDASGSPRYSVAELKAMKQVHQDWFEAARESLFRTRAPSLLAKVIRKLSKYDDTNDTPKQRPLSFKITEKISYNSIERHVRIIEKYSAYFTVVDCLYSELEAGPMKKVLNSIHDCYLSNCHPNQSADDILDRVQSALVERLNGQNVLKYSEDLEGCVKIIMVDAFMRCKVLEEPPQ